MDPGRGNPQPSASSPEQETETFMRLSTSFVLLVFLSIPPQTSAQHVSVLTQHNDPGRTGANLSEAALSPATVQPGKFGKLFSFDVDGQVYAQPLVVADLDIPGKGVHNVLYVATMKNNVYAFDADAQGTSDPLWHVNLGAPMKFDQIPQGPQTWFGTYNIKPWIGITSTPVIDPTTNRLYAVAKIVEGSKFVNRIHAIDIRDGTIIGRNDIELPLKDEPSELARAHLQRPGLLLSKGRIYAAFGSHQDGIPYHGWVVAFDADSLAQKYTLCTTCGGLLGMGGIWQSGNGPASDASGNIYIMIGNGDFNPGQSEYGDTFLKLSPDLSQVQWFAPADVTKLNLFDIDLGSAGPMLLPDKPWVVGGGKEGKLYLVDTNAPGGKQRRVWCRDKNNPPIQSFQAAEPWRFNWLNIFSWIPFIGLVYGYHHIHGSPVFWNTVLADGTSAAYIYIWPEDDNLKAFRYDATATPPRLPINTNPIRGMKNAKEGMPGGFLSISANQQKNGIVWAALPLAEDSYVADVQGTLRAFNATPQNNALQPLWCSDTEEPADNFNFAKFVPPTSANGRVYLATFSDRVNVYGLTDHAVSAGGKGPCQVKVLPAAKSARKPVPKRKHRRQRRG